ncbi:hypothetical protein ACTHAL_000160 [Priestia flexa]|uniref:Uncharacterized protein n=1 Tax=Priestia veravalensis TaxID=1414648 RepID=A0A0V8JJ72_9BACI|nr:MULTISPECIES: hypothetical protein [Priestia]KSU87091.1 hypothetical protein AS180_15090 [Priestia veravalensis]MCM3064843.1 hypothetical protein [Priestia flexa]SCC43248.1 hypothetical protein GA0061087_104323 [Priestia flexa]
MNIIQGIFEFIIGHLFLVIIVGGFILNVIQRYIGSGAEEEEKRPQRQPMPPVGNPTSREERNRPKRIPYRPSERNKKETVVEAKKDMKEEAQAVRNELQEKLEQLKTQREIPKRAETSSVSSINKKQDTSTRPVVFSKKAAIQGVIWSEVLGPPKSKRRSYKR